MPAPNARVTLRLSAVTSSREPSRYMQLRIKDVPSGKMIAEIDLDGEDLLNLFSSLSVGGIDGKDAWLIPAEQAPQLGKQKGIATRHFPSEHDDAAVQAWAIRMGRLLAADNTTWRRNNEQQHVVTFVYYIEEAICDEVMKANQAAMDDLAAPPKDPARRPR